MGAAGRGAERWAAVVAFLSPQRCGRSHTPSEQQRLWRASSSVCSVGEPSRAAAPPTPALS
ncbi:unnamed protein product [Rangifer tarandus platyrhynchus]|uniref:Uncharacterized protein n=2 Tax=Rangifer tarandus platyrhynchus TaxID=3082113 RepID=A0ABN8Y8V0_RANTA|nr:unnamed protein product [Rangifer tarandus platyrhynchus]CAI9695451.1 unnamed protein product [Rangifer tarandus platyrhynchus]